MADYLGSLVPEIRAAELPMGEELDFFLAMECRVWEALKLGDIKADEGLLADDFLGVYETGFGSRAEHISQLCNGPILSHYTFEVPRLIRLSPTLALLSYRAHCRDISGRPRSYYVTSIWEQRRQKWLNIFSQDTSAKDRQ